MLHSGYTDYQRTARNLSLEGSILHGELEVATGHVWVNADVDLNKHVANMDGVLTAVVCVCII